MARRTLTLASLTLTTLVACSPAAPNSKWDNWLDAGDDPSGGATSSTATASSSSTGTPVTLTSGQQLFIYQVFPTFQDAQCTLCHTVGAQGAPQFLSGATPLDVYSNVKTYRNGALVAHASVNLLLNKGDHEGKDLNAPQLATLRKWVDIENNGIDESMPTPTLYDSIDAFKACMSFQQFQNQKLDTLFSLTTNIGAQTCESCHSGANKDVTGGVVLVADAQKTFDRLKTFPAVFKLVTPAVTTDTGAFQKLIASRRFVDKGKEFQACDPQIALDLNFNVDDPTYCHPDYKVDQALDDGIGAFVLLALTRSQSEICTPNNTK